MVKIGVISCPKNEDMGQTVKSFIEEVGRSEIFRDIGPSECIGFVRCSGCPGKRVTEGAKFLHHFGADIIVLYSPNRHVCPHNDRILRQMSKQLAAAIVIDHFGKGV